MLTMIPEGLLNKQIAWDLGVSEATVKTHMTAIMHKLGVNNRTQVALLASWLAIDLNAVPPMRTSFVPWTACSWYRRR